MQTIGKTSSSICTALTRIIKHFSINFDVKKKKTYNHVAIDPVKIEVMMKLVFSPV